ncbi:hypothetical protein QE152_g25789 [Popillia japonica]|uniref:Uncharacterized protein n=1 Tax=Popillia japonica TaxID=7064 RepID=A0AAW1K091_POPJA
MPNTRPTRRSTRNTQHDEVRRNIRCSLSEPRQPTEPTTETIANADTSTRNTQHDEVRRNIRRSLSEPRQPTEPTTETIANADTYDLSTYFEAKWDDRAIQLIEAERKQTLLTLFSKLENSLIKDLNLMTADIGTMKAEIETMKADIDNEGRHWDNEETDKIRHKSTENRDYYGVSKYVANNIITEFRNMLQQHFDDLIHQKIKNSC